MVTALESSFEMSQDQRDRLIRSIPLFRQKKIVVLGDIGLDEYVLGEVRRISPEAPVPVLDVENVDLRLGLAGNVAQNVKSLGGEPLLISVMGVDEGAQSLTDLFHRHEVDTQWIVKDASRPTTRKMRVMAKHHHLCRVDYETRKYISEEIGNQLLQKVESLLPHAEALVIEDYAKGVISPLLIQKVIQMCKARNKKILVDPHVSNNGEFYQGADLIKPNFNEALQLSGLNYDDYRDHPNKIYNVGFALLKKTGAKEIVMTRGKDGMNIFTEDQVLEVPTYARQVFDVTGAGDTVIAALALSLSAGLTLADSCRIANFAAGVVVGQVGCVPCTVEDLVHYIQESN